MSQGPGGIALLTVLLVSAAFLAIQPASAHPYHLEIANETVSTPQPVDDIHWVAQSIVPASTFLVSRVTLWVRDDGTTGDPLVVSLRDDVSGAPGSSDITQGSAVGTTAPGGGWTDFDMAMYAELVGGGTYWIVVHSTASAGNGHSYWDSLTDLPYGPGTGRVSLDGVLWLPPVPPRDYSFRVYGFVQPSWSFSASQSTSSLAAGDSVDYRADFTNGGPGDAAALWVNFTLPVELQYVTDDAGAVGGVRTGTSFAFTGIGPGASSFTLTASVVGGLEDGTASSTMIAFTGTDHNGVAMAPVTRTFGFTIRAPRLSISLTSSPSLMDPGDDLTLNATVMNVGSSSASGVLLEGTVDQNATFNYTTSGFASYNAGTRTVGGTLAAIGPGEGASLVWNVTIPAGTPDLAAVRSNAMATYHDAAGSTMPVETRFTLGQVRAPVFAPALVVDQTFAEHGDVIAAATYFNNTGSGAALRALMNWDVIPNYALVDIVPATQSTPSPTGFDVSLANLGTGPHNLVARLRVVRALADGLAMPIQIRWTATDGNGNPLPPATLAASVLLHAPAVSIGLGPPSLQVVPGSQLTLDVTLRNSGRGAAAGWLNLTLPPAFAYVADNGSFPTNVVSRQVTWSVASLVPGTVASLAVRLRAPPARGTASVRFTFDYTDGRGSPVVPLVSESTSIEIAPVTEFTPALSVDRSFAEHGDEVFATLYFNNTGSAPARAASANWTLNGHYTLVDLSPVTPYTPTASGFEVSWVNLTVGSHSLVARLRVVRALADGLAMPIQVRWTATDGNGDSLAPATRAASVLLHAPAASIGLAPASLRVVPGSDLTLEVILRNTGGGAAVGWMNLTLPAGFGYVGDNGSFPTSVASGQVTWSVASLVPGTVASLAVQLRAPVARGITSIRFSFAYTDGRGSAVVSIVTGGTSVEIAPVTEFVPALAVDRSFAEHADEVLATLYFNNTGSASALSASASWTLSGHYLLVDLSSGTPSTPTPNGFAVSWVEVPVGSHLLAARLRVVRALADGLAMPIQVRWTATDGNGDALAPVTLNASVVLRAPGAAIGLAPSTLRVVSGSPFAVNVTVRNTGSRPATGWLNVSVPANLGYDADNGTLMRRAEGGKVTWTVASLPAGSTIYLAVRFQASGTGGSSSLRFTFDYTDGRGSPVGSVISAPVSVAIAELTAPFPVGAGVGVALLAVAVGAGVVALRRRRGRGELVIDDVFVVNDGGVLLAHRSSSLVQYADQDILVGMFKVVQEFVKDSFSKGVDEDMKGLEFGERRIMIEKGRHHFIAVVHRGSESAELRERVRKVSEEIDAKFGDTLARWKGLMEQVQGIANILPQVWGRQP